MAETKKQNVSGDASIPVSKWRRVKRLFIVSLLFCLSVVFLAIAVALFLYTSAQKEPEFYQSALNVSVEDGERSGDVFEQRLLDLHNDAATRQSWQTVFLEDDANGWLATDFIEKFPNILPKNITNPRVAFNENELKVAVKFQSERLNAVVVAAVEIFSTEIPRQFAVRIKSVKTGVLPLPVARFADQITRSIRKTGVNVSWTEIDGSPTALLDFPPDLIKLDGKQVEFDAAQLLDKKLILSGHTTRE